LHQVYSGHMVALLSGRASKAHATREPSTRLPNKAAATARGDGCKLMPRGWDQRVEFALLHDPEIDCPYKVVRYQAFLGLALDGLALGEHDL